MHCEDKMNDYGKVSIVVPVYNTDKYIAECIDSVKQQTYKNWELILVDDFSTDKSFEICCNFAQINDKIICLKNDLKGVSNARNKGITLASGKWIMFIDSDDVIKKNAIELFITNIQQYDLVVGGVEVVDKLEMTRKEFLPECFQGDIALFCKNIKKYTVPMPYMQSPAWKLFRLDIIKEYSIFFPPDLCYGEDTFFVYEYLDVIRNIKFINELTYTYYTRGVSLCHGFKKDKYQITLMLNKKLYALCLKYGTSDIDFYMENNRSAFSCYLNDIIVHNNFKETIEHLKTAAANPETIKCYNTKDRLSLKRNVIRLLLRLEAYHLLYCTAWLNLKMVGLLWRRRFENISSS